MSTATGAVAGAYLLPGSPLGRMTSSESPAVTKVDAGGFTLTSAEYWFTRPNTMPSGNLQPGAVHARQAGGELRQDFRQLWSRVEV